MFHEEERSLRDERHVFERFSIEISGFLYVIYVSYMFYMFSIYSICMLPLYSSKTEFYFPFIFSYFHFLLTSPNNCGFQIELRLPVNTVLENHKVSKIENFPKLLLFVL